MSLVCVLSPQGRVWWDFTQFLGSVYPPLCHSVHPPKRWGVNAGSPEALDRSQQPESIWPVCELWVTFQSLTTPGWKHVNLQTLPRLQIRVAAEKRVECQFGRPVWFFPLMQFQFLMSVFGCHFSMHRFIYLAFAATSILKCITRWRTRRRRTKTTKKQQLAFIRNEESDSSPPSCGLYVEISRASLAPKMNALFPNIQKFVLYGTN